MPHSKFEKINGNVLKIVACISMLIDHLTGGIMYPVVKYGHYTGTTPIQDLNRIYVFLRGVGRLAFPIYCFLLVEGFMHTKSRLRYSLSLLLFGLISEIPFDLLFFSETEVFNPNIFTALSANSYLLLDQCNVYFTLLMGLLTIWAIDLSQKFFIEKELPPYLKLITCALFSAVFGFIAYKINSDYDFYGVILIVIFYMLHNYRLLGLLAGFMFIANLGMEAYSFPAFILMALYSGKRGRNLGKFKYFFYLFYPVHLTVIYFIRCLAF